MASRQSEKITVLREWFECERCGKRYYLGDEDKAFDECCMHQGNCKVRDACTVCGVSLTAHTRLQHESCARNIAKRVAADYRPILQEQSQDDPNHRQKPKEPGGVPIPPHPMAGVAGGSERWAQILKESEGIAERDFLLLERPPFTMCNTCSGGDTRCTRQQIANCTRWLWHEIVAYRRKENKMDVYDPKDIARCAMCNGANWGVSVRYCDRTTCEVGNKCLEDDPLPEHMHLRCTRCGYEFAKRCKPKEAPKKEQCDPDPLEPVHVKQEQNDSGLPEPAALLQKIANYRACREKQEAEGGSLCKYGNAGSAENPPCAKCRSIGPHKKRHCDASCCSVGGQEHAAKGSAPEHFHFTCQGCGFKWATALAKKRISDNVYLENAYRRLKCSACDYKFEDICTKSQKAKCGCPFSSGPYCYPNAQQAQDVDKADACRADTTVVPHHSHPCRQFGEKQKRKRKHRSFRRTWRNVFPWVFFGLLLIGAGLGVRGAARYDWAARAARAAEAQKPKWKLAYQGALVKVEFLSTTSQHFTRGQHFNQAVLHFTDNTSMLVACVEEFGVVRPNVPVSVMRLLRSRNIRYVHNCGPVKLEYKEIDG